MTGYRVGSLIAGPALLKEVEKILDCVAICAPHISQAAALFGLQNLDSWKAEKIADDPRARRCPAAGFCPARPLL